ncbi:ABC transporter permease [Sphingomonas nostoxanthinifaciens]|uniref:ABC transporter permease n=1 Tax=Sphingomonas nostoxanthinifaciens TaxID=2872652 RepID=UPI001CC1D06F|nr:ABC transporter permease [Sphingomonas nostoxanthinifaciens]UAK25183.1 ABC transporter permease [Sphingomonas nostoxanthinifaciens]
MRAAAIALLALIVAGAALSLVWTPWDVGQIDVAHRLAPASLAHPLGTDQLGRDLLSMLMAGGVPSLGVGVLAVAIGLGVGVPLGLLAAAWPGWLDETIARASDVLFAFPALVLALLIVAVFGPGASHAALAIGLYNIPVFVRVTRAAARGIWARDFILAARLAGKGRSHISIEHMLPNIAGTLLVQAAVQLSLGVIAEAGLSFLGLGAQPPAASWGRMLADAQTLIGIAPRLALLPGLAIVATVLGINALAEHIEARRA